MATAPKMARKTLPDCVSFSSLRGSVSDRGNPEGVDRSGLLRCARNDEIEVVLTRSWRSSAEFLFISTPRNSSNSAFKIFLSKKALKYFFIQLPLHNFSTPQSAASNLRSWPDVPESLSRSARPDRCCAVDRFLFHH